MTIKNLKILIFSSLLLIFLPKAVFSQITLPPAEVEFYYQSIVIEPPLGAHSIKGYPGYLDIEWKGYYLTGETHHIIANCYFNCPNAEVYNAVFGPCQNCSSVGYPNETAPAVCRIMSPNYLVRQLNNVTCHFINPLDPTKTPYVYYNREDPSDPNNGKHPFVKFWPINFNISTNATFAVTVGTFELPIYIRNAGAIVDSYTVNITPKGVYANLVTVERVEKTENVSYGKIASALPKITFHSATPDPVTFEIKIKSNTEPIANLNTSCKTGIEDTNYAYFGNCSAIGASCEAGRCWKEFTVRIKAGAASLPEFDWFGIVQIMLLATIALIFVGKKLR